MMFRLMERQELVDTLSTGRKIENREVLAVLPCLKSRNEEGRQKVHSAIFGIA